MNLTEKIAAAQARIAELKIFIQSLEGQRAKIKAKDK